MQLIAIVLSIFAIVSSVSACVFVVRRKVRRKKEPTNSRLFLTFISIQLVFTASVFGFIFTKQILTTINNSPMNKLMVIASCKKIELTIIAISGMRNV